MVGASYTLNWDEKVDRRETGETSTWTSKQTLNVGYRGFLQPVIQNELTVKVEQERNSDGKNAVRVNPVITLGYKGAYWAAGARRTTEESNEPGVTQKVTDSYFVELLMKPVRATLPDLKAKYNLDKDFQQDLNDTSKHALTASSVYTPMDWLEIKGEYNRNESFDFLKPDADTIDSKISGVVGIRHMFSPKIRFVSEYRSEESSGWTILDAGGRTNEKKDTDQTWKNALTFIPFRATTIAATYDWDLKENKINGDDVTTQNFKLGASQAIGIANLRGDFTRVVTEPRNTADDNRKTEDTWTAEANLKFSQLFDFILKYQDKTSGEVHFSDPAKDVTSASKIFSGSWTGDLTVFWKASASWDRTDTYSNDVKTTTEEKYVINSTFSFKAINLLLDPSYTVTAKKDLQKTPPEEAETKDLKFRISWKVFSTYNMDARIDHVYGRKTDSLANNIQRTDDTVANLVWKEPISGWNVSFDVTRSATDTSEDDQSADVNSSAGVKVDYRGNQLAFATSYKYDIKTLSANAETFDAKIGWMGWRWDVTLAYAFTKTFSRELNEGYTISLAFKYNL